MVLKSWMYPRYQWLWKAKQPATQTTRHAICAMLKHPKVTDAFLFPLQSMFFDSLRMDRLSTAVWIDEDRCCQVVQFFFLPAIWALSQEVWASTKHHYLQRCFGCSWQGQKVGRQLSILAKGWLQKSSQSWLLNLILPKTVPQVVSWGLRICRSSYFETCVGCWLSGELRYHTGIMDNTLHQFSVERDHKNSLLKAFWHILTLPSRAWIVGINSIWGMTEKDFQQQTQLHSTQSTWQSLRRYQACSLTRNRRNPKQIRGLRVLDIFPQDVVQVSLVFDLLRFLLHVNTSKRASFERLPQRRSKQHVRNLNENGGGVYVSKFSGLQENQEMHLSTMALLDIDVRCRLAFGSMAVRYSSNGGPAP